MLRDSTDSFIVHKDLNLHEPGELLGKRQAGNIGYYLADLIRDEELFAIAQRLARHLIDDPTRGVSQLIHRWMPEASRYQCMVALATSLFLMDARLLIDKEVRLLWLMSNQGVRNRFGYSYGPYMNPPLTLL